MSDTCVAVGHIVVGLFDICLLADADSRPIQLFRYAAVSEGICVQNLSVCARVCVCLAPDSI